MSFKTIKCFLAQHPEGTTQENWGSALLFLCSKNLEHTTAQYLSAYNIFNLTEISNAIFSVEQFISYENFTETVGFNINVIHFVAKLQNRY